MSRKPIVDKVPNIGRPTVPSLPYPSDGFGPVGGVIDGISDGRIPLRDELQPVKPPTQPIKETRPEVGESAPRPPKSPVGGIIGGIGGGIPLPIVRPPRDPDKDPIGGTRPTKPRPDYKPDPKYAPGYGGAIGNTGPITHQFLDRDGDGIDDRKQKGPGIDPFTGKPDDRLLDRIKRKEEERREREERNRFIKEKRKTDPMYGFIKTPKEDRVKSTPRSRLEGSSRVRPVQDRRTRDFNPNLESFDAKQYLANYGDLQKAFGTDEAKARQHFIDYGMKEGRVDTAGGGILKAENRDRREKTFKAKSRAAAAKRREGFLRGEEGATFDAKQYLANYADLQKAFGSDEEKAIQHYRQYGAKEGRVDTKM